MARGLAAVAAVELVLAGGGQQHHVVVRRPRGLRPASCSMQIPGPCLRAVPTGCSQVRLPQLSSDPRLTKGVQSARGTGQDNLKAEWNGMESPRGWAARAIAVRPFRAGTGTGSAAVAAPNVRGERGPAAAPRDLRAAWKGAAGA